jgi:hypothetical protein
MRQLLSLFESSDILYLHYRFFGTLKTISKICKLTHIETVGFTRGFLSVSIIGISSDGE